MTPPAPLPSQRGSALLLAMLTVTLVATLAAASLWQQWQAVAVEQAQRQRTQAALILQGAIELGKFLTEEHYRTQEQYGEARPFRYDFDLADFKDNSPAFDLGRQKLYDNNELQQSVISISIQDINSCFNLRNLSSPLIKDGFNILRIIDGSDGETISQEEINDFHSLILKGLAGDLTGEVFDSNMAAKKIEKIANFTPLKFHNDEKYFITLLGFLKYFNDDKKNLICYAKKASKLNVNSAPIEILRHSVSPGLLAKLIERRNAGGIKIESDLRQIFANESSEENYQNFSIISQIYLLKINIKYRNSSIKKEMLLDFQAGGHLNDSSGDVSVIRSAE